MVIWGASFLGQVDRQGTVFLTLYGLKARFCGYYQGFKFNINYNLQRSC